MRKNTIFFLFLVTAFSSFAGSSSVNRQYPESVINWTKMEITASGSAPVAADALTYPHQLQNAYQEARQAARQRLFRTLLLLTIDRMQNLKTLLINRERIRRQLQNHVFSQAYELVPPYRKGKRIITEWRLKLTGNGSFYSMLPALYPFFSVPPATVFVYKGGYRYTGLVIDARHLKVSPSAGMKIFNDRGLLLYGPSFTKRFRYVRSGHILYLPSFTSPLVKRRAGKRFLYLHAASVKTKIGSDLVLFSRDADRILASPTIKSALKNCRVVVICRSRKRK